MASQQQIDGDDGAGGPGAAVRSRPWRRIGRGGAFLAGAVVASLLSATVAQGGVAPSFDDVPPSHPFYDEITDVATACVAGGYEDGTYGPSKPVTRQAMAAFLSRSFARPFIGSETGIAEPKLGTAAIGTSPVIDVLAVEVTVPDLPGNCSVPVEIESSLSVYGPNNQANTCHLPFCQVVAIISVEGEDVEASRTYLSMAADFQRAQLSPRALVRQPDNTTWVYKVNLYSSQVKTDAAVVAAPRQIMATVYPTASLGTVGP